MITDRAFPRYRSIIINGVVFLLWFSLLLRQRSLYWKPKVYYFYTEFRFSLYNICKYRIYKGESFFLFGQRQSLLYMLYCPYYAYVHCFLRWVRWLCYFTMQGLVRAARQQLRQAFGVRGQWLKPFPCTGATHSCGKHWRGDKRLVAFPLHWERQPTFCHQSYYSPPSPCGMINI